MELIIIFISNLGSWLDPIWDYSPLAKIQKTNYVFFMCQKQILKNKKYIYYFNIFLNKKIF